MVEPRATKLLLDGMETPKARLSGAMLDEYFPAAAALLIQCGLIEKDGYASVAPAPADLDEMPISLSWSPEDESYGYFDAAAGWVSVGATRLTRYRIEMVAVITSLLSRTSAKTLPAPRPLVDGLLWEVGDMRLPGRAKRLSIWFGRRLHDVTVWRQVQDMTRARPSPDLRLLLTSTSAFRLPAQSVHNHLVVSVSDVLDSHGDLVIDPAILAARVNNPFGAPDQIVKPSADFGVVSIRGKDYRFRGVKQRAIMRQLVLAWQAGQPKVLTAKVLLEAEYKDSVNTLAKAFAGRADWREFAAEQDGYCWLVV